MGLFEQDTDIRRFTQKSESFLFTPRPESNVCALAATDNRSAYVRSHSHAGLRLSSSLRRLISFQ
ncbi:protein of unknown function (plasmid) [Caballeronia sp. S22]